MKSPTLSFSQNFNIALNAAIEAGKEVIKIYKTDFNTQKKDDDSPITNADIKSNMIIKDILSKTGICILSEEEKDNKKRIHQDRIWIIDPLDGTTDFIKKTGEFTIMIGLVEKKKSVMGIIYWPANDTLFAAQKGMGSWIYCKETWKEIRVSNISKLSECSVVGSRYHISQKEKDLLKKLNLTKFTSIGSSLKVGKISSGEAEVYLTTTDKMKEWDTCASYCIISEAGGKMTDMLGNNLSYNNPSVNHKNGILVTNGLVHDQIVSEFQKLK